MKKLFLLVLCFISYVHLIQSMNSPFHGVAATYIKHSLRSQLPDQKPVSIFNTKIPVTPLTEANLEKHISSFSSIGPDTTSPISPPDKPKSIVANDNKESISEESSTGIRTIYSQIQPN